MLDQFAIDAARMVTRIVELTGITIIAVGAFSTLLILFIRLVKARNHNEAVTNLRARLGQAILLGLEFLVAADIINTVAVQPTLSSVAVLAGIVAIRTFLSFSLEMEIEGRLPWRRNVLRQGP